MATNSESDQKQGLRGAELSELYPEPKTFAERQAARDALDELKAKRWIQHNLWGTLVAIVAYVVTMTVLYVAMRWFAREAGAVATTFVAFPAGLIAVGLTIAILRRIGRIFS